MINVFNNSFLLIFFSLLILIVYWSSSCPSFHLDQDFGFRMLDKIPTETISSKEDMDQTPMVLHARSKDVRDTLFTDVTPRSASKIKQRGGRCWAVGGIQHRGI
jgi:hypothetical protein